MLPDTIVDSIISSMPMARPLNCGAYIQHLLDLYGDVERIQGVGPSDRVRRNLYRAVLATLEEFEMRVAQSHIISMCAILPHTDSIVERVFQARTYVEDHERMGIGELTHMCKLVASWKREAQTIVQELERLSRYLRGYIRSRGWWKTPGYMGDLVVPAGTAYAFLNTINDTDPAILGADKVVFERALMLDRAVNLPRIVRSIDDDDMADLDDTMARLG
jgi:hypothetical protein